MPWRRSPQICPSPAGISCFHQPRVASILKSNLKRNKGWIHLCLKAAFSHILLLARPPSWGIAPRAVTRAQLLQLGRGARHSPTTGILHSHQALSSKCSWDANILFFIGFFFLFSPLFYPFCTTAPWGPGGTSGQATSGSIY